MPECELGANCNRIGCEFKHPLKGKEVGFSLLRDVVEGMSFL